MADESGGYAASVFPASPPSRVGTNAVTAGAQGADPVTYRRLLDWLAAQGAAVGRGVQRAGQTMPETLAQEVTGGAEDIAAGLAHTRQGARDYVQAPITERGIPNVRGVLGGVAKTGLGVGRLVGAGPTALARGETELPVMVGEELTGRPRTAGIETARAIVEPFVAAAVPATLGARTVFRGGTAPLRNQGGWVRIDRNMRGLPVGFEGGPGPPGSSRAVFEGALSGRPGGPLHVDWLGATGGSEKGPGFAVGRPIMDEAANLARDAGYTGTWFTPLSSSGHQEGPRLARLEAGNDASRMGRERRIASNEIAMGNAAVQRGGGYEIPFPEPMPPTPPWYEAPPRIHERDWTRTPEEAARYHQELLAQSLQHRGRMRELRRSGVDPLEARAQSQRELDAARGAGQASPASQALLAQIRAQYPSTTVTPEQITDLARAYQRHYGRPPSEPVGLQQFALASGALSRADLDRLLGPPATARGVAPEPPADVGAVEPAMTRSAPSPARQAASREAARARQEAAEAPRLRDRSRRGFATTPEQAALLRRVEERQGAGMARETEQEIRRAQRAAGQGELFRGTEPTAQARAEPRARQRRASLDRAEQAARQPNRSELLSEGGGTRPDWDTAQRQRAEGTQGWEHPDVQGEIENFRNFYGRDPRTPREVLDHAREMRAYIDREGRRPFSAEQAARSPARVAWDDPDVAGALDLFRQYHGRDPRSPREVVDFLPTARDIEAGQRRR